MFWTSKSCWPSHTPHYNLHLQTSHQLLEKQVTIIPFTPQYFMGLLFSVEHLHYCSGSPLPNSPPSFQYLQYPVSNIIISPRLRGLVWTWWLDTWWCLISKYRIALWMTDVLCQNCTHSPPLFQDIKIWQQMRCVNLHFWLSQSTELPDSKALSPFSLHNPCLAVHSAVGGRGVENI
jgi:hypothetical protein